MADYYSDAAPGNPGNEPEPKSKDRTENAERDESNEPTAVLPKTILGGKEFKPGEEVMLEIVQVNEDSVVVKYASEKGEEGEHEESEEREQEQPSSMGGNPGGGSYYE